MDSIIFSVDTFWIWIVLVKSWWRVGEREKDQGRFVIDVRWRGKKEIEARALLAASSFTGVPISRIFLQPGRRDALAANKRRCPSRRRPLALQRSPQTLLFQGVRHRPSFFNWHYLPPYRFFFFFFVAKLFRYYKFNVINVAISVEYRRRYNWSRRWEDVKWKCDSCQGFGIGRVEEDCFVRILREKKRSILNKYFYKLNFLIESRF